MLKKIVKLNGRDIKIYFLGILVYNYREFS